MMELYLTHPHITSTALVDAQGALRYAVSTPFRGATTTLLRPVLSTGDRTSLKPLAQLEWGDGAPWAGVRDVIRFCEEERHAVSYLVRQNRLSRCVLSR